MNGRILIVEDNREISKLISDFLQQNEYEVRAVYDGDNAEKLLKRGIFQVNMLQ